MISSLLPPGSQIAIYPDHLNDGLGDFATAAQIAHLLFTREKLHLRQILLLSREPQKFASFNTHRFACLDIRQLTPDELEKIALFIIAPVGLALDPFFSAQKKRILILSEYNDRLERMDRPGDSMREVLLGLGPKAQGIPLDPALLSWRPHSSQGEMALLPLSLQKALLFPSPEELPYFLHVGYAKSPLLQYSFVAALSNFYREAGTKGRLIIVLPNFDLELIPLLPPSIEVVEYHPLEEPLSLLKEGKEGSLAIRIVSGFLPHDLFLTLLKASRREVMVTGDASLSEALSLGKRISYEAFPHKNTLSNELDKISLEQGVPVQICYRGTFPPQVDAERVKAQADSFLRHWRTPVPPDRDQDCKKWIARCDAWPSIRRELGTLLGAQENSVVEAEEVESDPPPRKTPCAIFRDVVRSCFARLFLSSNNSSKNLRPHFS